MDLSKLPNERKLYLCRWYFRAGFAMLPFLWGVNVFWFFKQAFIVPEYSEQKQIKKYVIYSAVGALICLSTISAWIYTFQTNRAAWGDFADSLTFVYPAGIP